VAVYSEKYFFLLAPLANFVLIGGPVLEQYLADKAAHAICTERLISYDQADLRIYEKRSPAFLPGFETASIETFSPQLY
jgi:hypothetical protein